MSNIEDERRAKITFAAIDKYIESNICLPTETQNRGRDMMEWGDGNRYPEYLLDLYNGVPTLRSIINGNIDFVTGDDVKVVRPLFGRAMNSKGETEREIVKSLAKDYEIYGGYALQLIRNAFGDVCEVYHLDIRYLRTNKDCNVFYYCEDWGKRGSHKVIIYPAYMSGLDWARMDDEARNAHASSVLYVKNINTQTYPAPLYAASVKACEIERSIDDYHLNAINNGFTGSLLVNFNGGVPDEDTMDEIEKNFQEKFSGHHNAGRPMFSWNRDRESETTLTELKIEDFGDRYQALAKHSRQQIFTAFRAIPLLFGLTSEANTGFSVDEFEQSFKLYNRTQIRPIQRLICDSFDKVYGETGSLTIVPFTLGGENEKIVK